MTVEAAFGAWLGIASLTATARSEALASAWGALAKSAERLSCYAEQRDADDEAARQITLFGQPMVVEQLQVPGLRIDLIGVAVTLVAERAGYQTGANVFVLRTAETEGVERTTLTVLRRLV